jgi:SAM-dependent methyltransferase
VDEGERTRQLAAQERTWFDDLYRAAASGNATVPWDRGNPNPLLVDWIERAQPDRSTLTIVVGSGYGRDSEYLASLGFPTTGFDISASAIEQTRGRFPGSTVSYQVADLLALPPDWRKAYGLVVESITVQAFPEPLRGAAIASVASLVAGGGTLLVIAAAHEGPAHERDAGDVPPWPLLREEVESFATGGLELVALERLSTETDPEIPRWRAEFRRL